MPIFDHLSGSPNWNPTITTPSIGSPITAQSIADGRQDLIDNDAYLNDKADQIWQGRYARLTLGNAYSTVVNGYNVFNPTITDNPKNIVSVGSGTDAHRITLTGNSTYIFNITGRIDLIGSSTADYSEAAIVQPGSSNVITYFILPFYDVQTPGNKLNGYFNHSVVLPVPGNLTFSFGVKFPSSISGISNLSVLSIARVAGI